MGVVRLESLKSSADERRKANARLWTEEMRQKMGVDGAEDRTGRGAMRGEGPSVGRATKEGRGRGGGAGKGLRAPGRCLRNPKEKRWQLPEAQF